MAPAPVPPQNPEPEETGEEKTPETPAATASADGDISVMWGGILGNIESMPSRMFFHSLSRPVALSPEEIVISFAKEIFVKQAKEDSKNMPLKKAAMEYFNVSDINLTIKLADASEPAPVSPKLSQIIEKKKELTPPPQAVIEKELEEENAEALSAEIAPKKPSEPQPENYSDQTRMVLDLFNGKIIE